VHSELHDEKEKALALHEAAYEDLSKTAAK